MKKICGINKGPMNVPAAGIRSRVLYCLCSFVCILFSVFCVLSSSDAKIYIDISSPGIRQLPVSIKVTGPPKSKEIEWIVKSDLETTGLFEMVDPDVPGAEIVADLNVEIADELKVIFSVTDLVENRELTKRRLVSSKRNIRPISHRISDVIHETATGRKGIFRTKISYLAHISSGRKGLRIMDWDGFNSKRIVSSGLTSSHSWSQDGEYIVYSSERKRKWNIYLLNLSRSQRESVLFTSKGLNLVGGTSPDNSISFSSSRDGSSEIYIINMYGKGFKKLTRSFGIEVSPVFSSDGSKLAFVSDRGGTPQIYLMDAEGRGIKRITFEGSYNTQPSWSPDGKRIAYSGRKNGKNQIFVVQSDGTELRQITDKGNNESPSFSPDGMLIAFDSDREGGRGIYIMRANGEGQKRITRKKIRASIPRWSPYLQ